MKLSDAHLILFLTAGTRLSDWHSSGLLAREAELYQRLRPHLASIAWVSYGGQADLDFQTMLPDIQILVNRWRLPNQVYAQQLPWLHQAAFQRATILKSEQTGAAEAALTVAGHYGLRYVARSGFSLALFAGYAPESYSEGYDRILELERRSFAAAQQIVVTTDEMHESAMALHAPPPSKIRVIPNYVNTARFQPAPPRQTERPLVLFVGRLTEQKNVLNLLEAVAPLTHIDVEMIGGGELRPVLESQIAQNGLKHIRLMGNVPNDQLPNYFQRATVYLQPSRYEGHPKTIFEAMACGLPVLVGDAPGIRQFIRHGETGWLCELDAEAIRQALENLLSQPDLQARLGHNAREYVVANYSLDSVVRQEVAMLETTLTLPPMAANPQPRPIIRSALTYAARLGVLLRRRISSRQ